MECETQYIHMKVNFLQQDIYDGILDSGCFVFCFHSPKLWFLMEYIVNDNFELIRIGRSDFLTVMLVNLQIFWDLTLCHWLKSAWCYQKLSFLHPHGQAVQEEYKLV